MFNYLKKTKPIHYVLAIFLLGLIYSFISHDKLPFKYSNIFDEKQYLQIVQSFPYFVRHHNFNPYYISRLLIPGIVHYIIRFSNQDYGINTVQNVFLGLNFLSILVCIYYYFKIVKEKKYSSDIVMIGFCFLFINFFILKFPGFYPILMDIFGFTSGIMLYYYHLTKQKIIFHVFLAFFMFIFPTTILILLAKILSDIIVFKEKGLPIILHLNKWLWGILLLIMILLGGFYCINHHNIFVHSSSDFGTQISPKIIPITLLLFGVFLYFVIKQLLMLINNISISFKGLLVPTFYLTFLIFVFYFLISKFLSISYHGPQILSSGSFITNLTYQIISFPLKFLITHFIYYGLFVVFVVFFYKSLFLSAKENSDTLQKIIFIIFTVFFIVGTETRQFLQLFPFVLFILLDSLTKYKFSNKLIAGIFIFQLAWSRFWYNIDNPEGFLLYALRDKKFTDFPAQRYFQFQGPWLSENNAIIYGIIFIIIYLIFYKILKRQFKIN